MHLVQGKVRMFDPNENVLAKLGFDRLENNEALLEGRAGPEFERGSDASRKEERRPARRERSAG